MGVHDKFYNTEIEFFDHGEWSDAELILDYQTASFSEVKELLYEEFLEQGIEQNGGDFEDNLKDGDFDNWLFNNPNEIYYCFDVVYDNCTEKTEYQESRDYFDGIQHFYQEYNEEVKDKINDANKILEKLRNGANFWEIDDLEYEFVEVINEIKSKVK